MLLPLSQRTPKAKSAKSRTIFRVFGDFARTPVYNSFETVDSCGAQIARATEMNRVEFQRLADLRVADAESLIYASRWEAAYHLLGYGIECAFKACIAKRFLQHDVPARKLIDSFYTHRLEQLLVTSQLQDQLNERRQSDPGFRDNWGFVTEWNESARYETSVEESQARDMLRAVTDAESGILTWLKDMW